MILNRLAEDLDELAVVEQRPQQDGRNMTMMLGPGATAGHAGQAPATSAQRCGGSVARSARRRRAAGAGGAAILPRLVMPKMKSHSGAKKRFKVTGTGKVQARHSFSSHILEKKSPKRKRHMHAGRSTSSRATRVVPSSC